MVLLREVPASLGIEWSSAPRTTSPTPSRETRAIRPGPSKTMGEIYSGINSYTVTTDAGPVEAALFGSHDNFLYCVNVADGAKLWGVETGYYVNGTPCISSEGNIAFGGCDGYIYVVNAQKGDEVALRSRSKRISQILSSSRGTPPMSLTTTTAWKHTTSRKGSRSGSFESATSPTLPPPAVTADRVYAGGQDKRMHCLDSKTGDEIWSFRAAGRIDSSPIVAGNQVIFGSDDGVLYFVDATTGDELWRYEIGEEIKSSPAIIGGTLVVGASDGKIYAFESE